MSITNTIVKIVFRRTLSKLRFQNYFYASKFYNRISIGIRVLPKKSISKIVGKSGKKAP
jgi:hypothetical protein